MKTKSTFSKTLLKVAVLGTTAMQMSTLMTPIVSVLAETNNVSTETTTKDSNKRTEEIPFNTKTVDDDTLPEGERKVVQKGEKGLKEFITTTPTSTKTERKDADVMVPYDVSGSTNAGENELGHLKAVVESGTDGTRYQLFTYTDNGEKTYTFGSTSQNYRVASKMLTKKEILAFIADVEKRIAEGQSGFRFMDALIQGGYVHPKYNYSYEGSKDESKWVPFEQVFEAERDKSKAATTIMITDNWAQANEQADTSYIDYVKNTLKGNGMAIVFGSKEGQAYKDLTARGFKVVATSAGLSDATRKELTSMFEQVTSSPVKGQPKTEEKIIKQPNDEIVHIGTKKAEEPKPQQTRRTEKIPFQTKYITDDNLEFGQEVEVQPGIEGEKEFITTVTPGKKAVAGKATGELKFTTKAPVSTNKTTETKPTVLVGVMDLSSSYRYKRDEAIDQLIMLIEKALTNKDSKVILQFYTMNRSTSYSVNRDTDPGYSSVLLTKDEAIKILKEIKTMKNPSMGGFNGSFNDYFNAVEKALGDKNYSIPKTGNEEVPFEDIVNKVTKKSDTISVIQFTDGWDDGKASGSPSMTGTVEAIDETFANWAKDRAKTFMTVVNRNKTEASNGSNDKDTNSNKSIDDMKRLGHPNIYDSTGKDKATIDKELLAKFMETAVEKVSTTKGEDQTAVIKIGGDKAKITKATLKGGSVTKELAIKDGKVDISEKLPDSDYTITFEAEGEGDVTGTITIDGKVVDTKTVSLKGEAGTEDTSNETENIIKQPQDRIIAKGTKGSETEKEVEKIPFEVEYIEDDTIPEGEERVVTEGEEGEKEIIKIYQTKNGERVGEPDVSENIVKQAKNKVIARGTKKPKKELPKKQLPKTNDVSAIGGVLGGSGILGAIGAFLFKRKK